MPDVRSFVAAAQPAGRRAAGMVLSAAGALALVCTFAFAKPPAASGPADPSPLPRIAVRDGRFAEKHFGKPFAPLGFNYIRLRPRWHSTFDPDQYDPNAADAMLAAMRPAGFNTVRVFIDPGPKRGLSAGVGAPGFSRAYVDNVLDFLARATKHRVYVIPALLMLPPSREYNELAGRERRLFNHGNEMYLEDGFIKAKARFVADFLAAVKAHDARLLPTILACELDNETHFLANGDPFSRGEGIFHWNGKSYDLASSEDCQKLADEAVIRWADACVDAARGVDADALISVNVFTFAAVGRTGPGRLRQDQSSDRRFPARPAALARTKLAYLDIHFYPFDDKTLNRDLASIEWDALAAACKAAGKPLIMGEFGSFIKNQKTLAEAVTAMKEHLERVRKLGFAGWLYWTYDTDEQAYLWNARSGGGAILRILSEAAKSGQW